MRILILLTSLVAASLLPATGALAASVPAIDIPFQKTVLPNGLTLITHVDKKAPIVAVNVWYHIGSKDETPGKTGFAHLFEHLMFQGSENYDHDFFRALEVAGTTDMNGTTSTDRTNYFETVPVGALDRVLWLESDRMGHFLGVLDQAKLDEQRGVVKNEKRQRNNAPYGRVWEILPPNSYPQDHPYSWSVIGSMDDLDHASLADARAWFKRYYGPNNAVLVVAGDIDPATVREKVLHYFGDIPGGPPLPHQQAWIAPMQTRHVMTLEDRVPQARLYQVWNVPGASDVREQQLRLAAQILADGETSRLYQRLVKDDKLATDVEAFINSRELGSQFILITSARPGVSLSQLQHAIDDELAKLRSDGPSNDEVARARTSLLTDFVRGLEKIGGFTGKANVLAESEVFGGSPDFYKQQLQALRQADVDSVRRSVAKWLGQGSFLLQVKPFAEPVAADHGADRSQLPALGQVENLHFPNLQRFTLNNGLPVIFAQRGNVPVTQVQLIFNGGYALDKQAELGRADLAMSMLDKGTASHSASEFAAALQRLGAQFSASANLDVSTVSLSAMNNTLAPALAFLAEAVREPAFPNDALARVRVQKLAQLKQEKARPTSMALRLLPPLLYGKGHPYAKPLTGTGTPSSIQALQAADLRAYQQQVLRPDNATLIVVGNVQADTLQPDLEAAFSDWHAPKFVRRASLSVPRVAQPAATRVYLVDRPGAVQSVIIAGELLPARGNPDELAFKLGNEVLGGLFTSRLNMNLREGKHWSYGAGSFVLDTRAQRPLLLYAPVQTDHTADAMREMLGEVKGIVSKQPVTSGEMTRATGSLTRSMAGKYETNAALLGALAEQLIYGLPDDYYSSYIGRLDALQREQVNRALKRELSPKQLTWIVVGDLQRIGQQVRALNIGPVKVLDAGADKATGKHD